MFAKNKVSQSMIDAVNSVINEDKVEEASEKVPTPTGMKVYGSSYGNSAKARKDQTKHSVDAVKGPKAKDLVEDGDCVTPPQAKGIAKKEIKGHEKKMHKENVFYKLAKELQENKATGTEPTFTDNNIGEMSDKQMAKREKIVLSMKKGEAGFKQRYGKNWKNVMYATATKQAMKEDSSDEWEGEELDEEESGLRMAAHAAAREGKKEFKFLGKTLPVKVKKEEAELDEATPAKNQDVADKAYLKHKPGTVKGTMTQLGRFLRGKPEIKEETIEEKNNSHTHAAHYENEKGEWTGMNLFAAKDDQDAIKQAHAKCKEGCRLSRVERHIAVKESVQIQATKTGDKITTDMLSGREKGGKLNAFKSYKVDLTTNGIEAVSKDYDIGDDTKEKQKITTNPGPVDIKFDDKLGTPQTQKYFSTQDQITSEEVRGELKVLRNKAKEHHNKDIDTFNKKVAQKEEVEEVLEKVIAGTPGWEKIKGADPKGNIKDKSGAIHTPMSRAKDLARKTFVKLKKETMMGKISN
jgi:hypothetical protein